MARRLERTPEQLEAIKQTLRKGGTMQDALLAGGYSANVARKGKAALSRPMRAIIMQEFGELARIGRNIKAADVEAAIAGKMLENMITGESKGNEAAKLLGGMRRHDVFRPESQAGLIVIQMPESLAHKPEPKQLEAEEVLDLAPPKLLGE